MNKLPKSCCIFCGQRADSLEHVIAKRLFKRAKAEQFEIAVGKTVEGEGDYSRTPHTLENLKVRCVCQKCNNGWMNDLEAWFESKLGFLIEPAWPRFANEMIEVVKAEKENLARWMMKTVVTINEVSMTDKIFSSDLTLKLKSGFIPQSVVVDLGYSRLSTVGFTFNEGFQVINGGQYNRNQRTPARTAFKFIAQFNHLLLRLTRAPQAKVTYWSLKGELPILVYPQPAKQNPHLFEYESLMDFDHSVCLETDMTYHKAEVEV